MPWGLTVCHGNSKASTKTQHGYEIYNIQTNDVVKTGMPNRAEALDWERMNASRLYSAGNSMNKHVRPRP